MGDPDWIMYTSSLRTETPKSREADENSQFYGRFSFSLAHCVVLCNDHEISGETLSSVCLLFILHPSNREQVPFVRRIVDDDAIVRLFYVL